MWTFFGLTPEYKVILHREVFGLCYNGNGGFTHSEVYNMPIHLRHFYIKQLTDSKHDEIRRQEEAAKKSSPSTPPKKITAGPQ